MSKEANYPFFKYEQFLFKDSKFLKCRESSISYELYGFSVRIAKARGNIYKLKVKSLDKSNERSMACHVLPESVKDFVLFYIDEARGL